MPVERHVVPAERYEVHSIADHVELPSFEDAIDAALWIEGMQALPEPLIVAALGRHHPRALDGERPVAASIHQGRKRPRVL